MAQTRKKAVNLTTEEAIRRLFPKRVIEQARRVASRSTPRDRRIAGDARG